MRFSKFFKTHAAILPRMVALLAGLGCAAATHANLLTNGSFENAAGTFVDGSPVDGYMVVSSGVNPSAIPGWRVFAFDVGWETVGPFGVLASNGAFQIDLTGAPDVTGQYGGVTQTFSTSAGAKYHLSFDLGAYNGNCGGLDCSGPMGVRVALTALGPNTVTQQDFTGYDPTAPGQNWKTFGMDFVAGSASTQLEIGGIQAGKAYLGLDNVAVTAVAAPVPEPETYAMLVVGLGLVGAVARRRKTKDVNKSKELK